VADLVDGQIPKIQPPMDPGAPRCSPALIVAACPSLTFVETSLVPAKAKVSVYAPPRPHRCDRTALTGVLIVDRARRLLQGRSFSANLSMRFPLSWKNFLQALALPMQKHFQKPFPKWN
jgi:hypothetical protein